MLELPITRAKKKSIRGRQYYIFPLSSGHTNYRQRPNQIADPRALTVYKGKGSNNKEVLLPAVLGPAHALLTAMIAYGEKINDWSLKSAVVQSGYRPDDDSAGKAYLRGLKRIIKIRPTDFGGREFPSNLESDAKGVLGPPGDPRRAKLIADVGRASGWTPELAKTLFEIAAGVIAPQGSNPHATGLVFDLEFSIMNPDSGGEEHLHAAPERNPNALRSAAGQWLNTYSMQFGFDSYDTNIEIWHMEYRSPSSGPGSAGHIALLNCCKAGLDLIDASLQITESAIAAFLRSRPR